MTTDIVTPAATETDSAPVIEQTPVTLPELSTLTPEQRQTWRETGNLPQPSDSAPDKGKTAAADSAPQKTEGKQDKTADSASDSATDRRQQPRPKTKEDTERRFNELLESNKKLQQRLDEIERTKTSDKREGKPESQPAAEVKAPSLKQYLETFFAKPENKGKGYEDGVEAWQVARETHNGKQLEQQIRAQIANEAAQRDLVAKVEEAKTRYPDFDMDTRIVPAATALMSDAQIPHAVKATISDSPVFVDLMYTLSEPKALADLIDTAKKNPSAALRKVILTEQLIQAELAKGKPAPANGADSTATTPQRDETGKFRKTESSEDKDTDAAEPITRAPHKTPVEVGGRTSAPEDGAMAAVKANDFRRAKEEFTREYAARQR